MKTKQTTHFAGAADRSTRRAIRDISAAAMKKDREAGTAAHAEYRAYIASPAWRENPARLAELQAAWGRCRLCNRGPPTVRIEVHHRTYRNLGCERSEDLTTLCETCHGVVTDMLRQRRQSIPFAWRR